MSLKNHPNRKIRIPAMWRKVMNTHVLRLNNEQRHTVLTRKTVGVPGVVTTKTGDSLRVMVKGTLVVVKENSLRVVQT